MMDGYYSVAAISMMTTSTQWLLGQLSGCWAMLPAPWPALVSAVPLPRVVGDVLHRSVLAMSNAHPY